MADMKGESLATASSLADLFLYGWNATDDLKVPASLLAGLGQIQFPATQNPSSDPNNLDDYEEGSWTPGISFGGSSASVTYSLQTGTYTKVGNRVFFEGRITLTNNGSGTGYAKITGLPFTSGNYGACTISYYANLSGISGVALAHVETAATTIQLRNGNAVTSDALTDTNIPNTADILFFGNYKV